MEPNVFAFSYPDEATSARVYQRNFRQLRQASAWRTTNTERSVWRIVCVDQSGVADRLDWTPGVPVELPEDEVAAFILRRLNLALDAAARGDEHVRVEQNFGAGKYLRPDGSVTDP